LCKSNTRGQQRNFYRQFHWHFGHGKRGGARMICYWVVAHDRRLMLDIYAKNEKEDLSAGELKQLRTLIEDYKT
jgi:hypothetical protein